MEISRELALSAQRGDIDAVKDWLAAGGAPDAKIEGSTLLEIASNSSRPSCASVVELLCAAGARDDYDAPRGHHMCRAGRHRSRALGFGGTP